jgi:hypothetical protein
MQSGIYQLRDGRKVFVRYLAVTRTYDGLLMGTQKAGSKLVLEMLKEQAQNRKPPEPPLLMIEPEKLPLPDYMWTAELESRRAVRTDDPDFGSHLSICWFAENLAESIDVAVASQLRLITWDEHATDYDITLQ